LNDAPRKTASTISLAALVTASGDGLSGEKLVANDRGGNVGSRSSGPFWQKL